MSEETPGAEVQPQEDVHDFGTDSPSPTVDSGEHPAANPEANPEARAGVNPAPTTESPAAASEAAPEAEVEAAPEVLVPASAPEPSDPDESWLRNFGTWVKEHPAFALFLFGLIFVLPWGLNSLQQQLARQQVEQVLWGWEGALVEAGLPLAGLEPREVSLPGELNVRQRRVLEAVGLTARSQALLAWAALRAGRQPAEPLAGDSDLTQLIQACALLHRAQQGTAGGGWVRELQSLIAEVPSRMQPLLRMGQALVEGRTAEVLAQAEGTADGGDRLVALTLQALVASVTTRRVRELVAARPATLDSLEELAHYAGKRPDDVRAALGSDRIEGWVKLGGGDVERAGALLGLFSVLRESGAVSDELWGGARDDVLAVVIANWSTWEQDYKPARALLLACFQQDPQARFPLGRVLKGWRPQLQRAVNDRPALHQLAVRLFELGVVPPVLEQLSSLLVGLESVGQDTPGRALGVALVAVCRAEASGGDVGDAEVASGAIEHLEALLAERGDWVADQLRAWATCLRARLALAHGPEATAESLLRGLLDGSVATLPAFRVRGWLVRALLSQELYPPALQVATQALAELDAFEVLPESYQEQDSTVAEALEAAGRPSERGAFLRLRSLAALDLADAALGVDGEVSSGALDSADGEDPRVYFIRARQAELAQQGPQAVAATTRGLSREPGPWLERRLKALLDRVRPR